MRDWPTACLDKSSCLKGEEKNVVEGKEFRWVLSWKQIFIPGSTPLWPDQKILAHYRLKTWSKAWIQCQIVANALETLGHNVDLAAGDAVRATRLPPGLKPPPPPGRKPSWLGTLCMVLGGASSLSSCLRLQLQMKVQIIFLYTRNSLQVQISCRVDMSFRTRWIQSAGLIGFAAATLLCYMLLA